MRKKRHKPHQALIQAPQPASMPAMHYWVMLWLLGITSVLYWRTLDYPMVFDDIAYLQQNPVFVDSQSYSFPLHYQEFLNRPRQVGFDPELAMNFVLRPVAYATLHLNYLLDGFNPRWYRLFNVAIHTANACLVYFVLLALIKVAGNSLSRASQTRIAVLASTLFAAHPLAIESVTYIVQRFTSLGAFFFLLTMLLQIQAWGETDPRSRRWRKGSALGVLLLGLFTKECTIAAPVMLVLIDTLVCHTHWRQALWRNRALLACLPIIPLHVVLISWVQNAGALDLGHAINMTNQQAAPYAHGDFLLTQVTVLVHYLRLIVWPTDLTLDPEWPLYHSLFAPPVLLSGMIILAVLSLAGWIWWRARTDLRSSLATVFTLWFFITIAPASGLVPLPDLVAEHRSYLPSLGIFITLASLLDQAFSRIVPLPRLRYLAQAATLLTALMLGTLTWQRNAVWSSEIILWADVTHKSPGRARAWNNLGTAYTKAGRLEDAIAAYTQAIELLPRYELPYLNLMICHNQRQEFHATLQVRERLAQISPEAIENMQTRYMEALARFGLEQLDESTVLLNLIVQAAPNFRPALILLGSSHQIQHHHAKALKYLERAASIEAPNASLKEMIETSRKNLSIAGTGE